MRRLPLLLSFMLLPAVALFAKSLTKAEADACRAQLAAEWKQAIRSSHQARWERSEAEVNGLPMQFWKAVYGEKPADGRSLWISLHGGGNTHPLMNDQQWDNQKRLYRPAE
ncbi:MAG: hypothetical protein J6O49_08935, partial [Bacteroidaceae bacterium]|nr:hypothetical protein [Bacteroidaceae bacterium]